MSTVGESNKTCALNELPHVALMHVMRFLPYDDRKKLSILNQKLKFIHRIVSSNLARPEAITINAYDDCCKNLIHFAYELSLRGLKFDGIKGICIRLGNSRIAPCEGVQNQSDQNNLESFVHIPLAFKYMLLQLEDPNHIATSCPSREVIRTMVHNHMKSLKTLCLHHRAINWIVGDEGVAKFCSPFYFQNLEELEINASFACPLLIKRILEIAPNLKRLNVHGNITLQHLIPLDRISLVTNMYIRGMDGSKEEEHLRALASKMPKLKQLDIGVTSRNVGMLKCVQVLLQRNHSTLEQLHCATFTFWGGVLAAPQPFFPCCKLFSIYCNYKELRRNYDPIRNLKIELLFPNLEILRIMSSQRTNLDIFEGVPLNSIGPNTVSKVTKLAFETRVTMPVLRNFKSQFPEVSTVIIRENASIRSLAAIWNDLQSLEIVLHCSHTKQNTLAATLLGIHVKEVSEVLFGKSYEFIYNYHIVPIKPGIFDAFQGLKRLTIMHHRLTKNYFFRNITKLVARRGLGVDVNIFCADSEDYYWSNSFCNYFGPYA